MRQKNLKDGFQEWLRRGFEKLTPKLVPFGNIAMFSRARISAFEYEYITLSKFVKIGLDYPGTAV